MVVICGQEALCFSGSQEASDCFEEEHVDLVLPDGWS